MLPHAILQLKSALLSKNLLRESKGRYYVLRVVSGRLCRLRLALNQTLC